LSILPPEIITLIAISSLSNAWRGVLYLRLHVEKREVEIEHAQLLAGAQRVHEADLGALDNLVRGRKYAVRINRDSTIVRKAVSVKASMRANTRTSLIFRSFRAANAAASCGDLAAASAASASGR
jgi:hypothetical protein